MGRSTAVVAATDKKKSKYNVSDAMESLEKKHVNFDAANMIDISDAVPLGNKSWGKIDFLKKKGMRVTGFGKYIKRCKE